MRDTISGQCWRFLQNPHAAGVVLAAIVMMGSAGGANAAQCLTEAYGGDLNCTANDISIASVEITNVDDPCTGAGDTVTFDAILHIQSTATQRYDIGFYLGQDALSSTNDDCAVVVIPPGTQPNQDGDACGDVQSVGEILVPVQNITATCTDADNNNFLDISTCSTWRQNADATDCAGPEDALPGTKSKCNCALVNTTLQIPQCTTNAECADQNVCTDDVCNPADPNADEFGCVVTNNTASCEDGLFCNGAEVCAGGACQAGTDPCIGGGICGDVCNEIANNCFDAAGTVCRAAGGVCDAAEVCTGTSAACPADTVLPSTSQCRAAAGLCDTAEFCTGTGSACPADVVAGSNTVCRAANGVCDVAEVCNGVNGTCPADAFLPSTSSCRASTGECDVAEQCTGISGTCPANVSAPNGTTCTTDNNVCTNDVCTDGACTHPNNTAACDDGAFCTVGDACVAGQCAGTPRVCDDQQECSVDACNETTNQCDFAPCLPDGGFEICRSPGFWATHPAVTEALFDEIGPIEVCGVTLSTTDPGSLASTLEALCVSVQGVDERQLFRQLVAAALNCAVSGSDGNCDELVSIFGACSDLCAGNPVIEVDVGECVDLLDCVNNGGQELEEGGCALGTCASQPSILCGGTEGDCPLFNDLPQECVPFEDNCHDEELCNEDLGFCPDSDRADPKPCKEARSNQCTIDSCP